MTSATMTADATDTGLPGDITVPLLDLLSRLSPERDRGRFPSHTTNAEQDDAQQDDAQQDDAERQEAQQRHGRGEKNRPPPASGVPDDATILSKIMGSKAGDAYFTGDPSRWGNDESRRDLAVAGLIAFFVGPDRPRIDRLFRQSKCMRPKWDEPRGAHTYGELTIAKALEGRREFYKWHGREAENGATATTLPDDDVRPVVMVTTDEHLVAEATLDALQAEPNLYVRGGSLSRVLRGERHDDKVRRANDAPIIANLPAPVLRELMSRHARFRQTVKRGRDEYDVECHVPNWLVNAVHQRGEWPMFRPLEGVTDTPVLRADGTIFQVPGYDELTGMVYAPGAARFPKIPEDITPEDAREALLDLLGLVCDFKFERPHHQSAFLASLLTPAARAAYEGCTPVFLFDANVRGVGKTLLTQIVGLVHLGADIPIVSYSADSAELTKLITSIALAGDRLVCFDNIGETFGNEVLDRAVTATRWRDRILGQSAMTDLSLRTVWFGTGNNISVAADTARRVLPIRLDVLDEKPEERGGFVIPDILGYVREHRGEIIAKVLTVLRGYILAGRPKQDVTPFGSFEGWSRLVREAVVWAGLPDPCLARQEMATTTDSVGDTLGQLLTAWKDYDPLGRGLVVADLIGPLWGREFPSTDAASLALKTALENITAVPPGRPPSTRQIGAKLKAYRRRVLGGVYLDISGKTDTGARWVLLNVSKGGSK